MYESLIQICFNCTYTWALYFSFASKDTKHRIVPTHP